MQTGRRSEKGVSQKTCHVNPVLMLSRIELRTNTASGCFVDFSFLASYLGKLLYK